MVGNNILTSIIFGLCIVQHLLWLTEWPWSAEHCLSLVMPVIFPLRLVAGPALHLLPRRGASVRRHTHRQSDRCSIMI
jgi:hypothetical protein